MSNNIADTKQIAKLKELSLNGAYFNCGEIYKLLNYKELHHLSKYIKKGTIKLKSKLIYGKLEISNEEKFLENLDHYITYVKNHYHIEPMEQLLLAQIGLDNKYAKKCLLLLNDFHSDSNYYQYFNYFRRMFLFSIYDNIFYYAPKVANSSSIVRAYNELKKYDFDDDTDIIKIEKYFLDVLRFRDNNLCSAFDSHKKIVKKEQTDFFVFQLEWVLNDYYENIEESKYIIKKTDHIVKSQATTILFNINTDISKCRKKDKVEIEFGIFNKYINCKKDNIILRKEEFDIIYEMIEDIANEKKIYRDVISFVDSTLKFDFDFEGADRYLDIIYVLPNCGGDFYNISMNKKEIIKLYELLKKQL